MADAVLAVAAVGAPLDQRSTLCLYPVELPLDKEDGEQRRFDLERRLRDALTAAAFVVPDPQAVLEASERMRAEVGGFVDTATGSRDETRYRAFLQRRADALRGELGCDALLFANVVLVRALFAGRNAVWDGTTDEVSSVGRIVMQALGGVVERGWVAALSLWLHVVDLEGNDLAFRSAGIESLVNLSVTHDQDVLPQDLWLTNTAKLDGAIRSALGPNGEALRLRGAPLAAATEPR